MSAIEWRAFSDGAMSVFSSRKRRVPPRPWIRSRYRLTVGAVLLVLAVYSVELVDLQLVHQDEYLSQTRGNAVDEIPVLPARGQMFDRDGRLLVANEPAFSVVVTPAVLRAGQVPELARLMGLPDTTVARRIQEARDHNPNTAVPIAQGLSPGVAARLHEQLFRLPGVQVVEGQRRTYLGGVDAPFVFGTVGEIGPDELAWKRAAHMGYRLGDIVGRTGMEQAYEEALRGRPGSRFVIVDAFGRERGAWNEGRRDTEPTSAYDLTLSLDATVQAVAESLFVNKRGAAVALDPRNGEVIAYVSAPAYDPALIVPPVAPETWSRLTADSDRPLFDRAALSSQPLGSTIKPFMALLGLQEGTLDETTTIHCGGAYVWGGHVFRDHGAHGRVNVHDAIRRSCNVFFFSTMMRTSFDAWTDFGHAVGFGRPVPSDLSGLGIGQWPDSTYFDETFGAWTRGYLVSMGIGQGDLGVTPVQMARYAALLANGGTPVTPHFARELRNPETGGVMLPGIPVQEPLAFDPAHMKLVREAMLAVVESGTGRRSRIDGIAMAGKTGTAENPHGEDHALFVAFAPFEDPRIAVAVLVENAGFGSTSAAPIASFMVEQFLHRRIAPERRALFERTLAIRSAPPETPLAP